MEIQHPKTYEMLQGSSKRKFAVINAYIKKKDLKQPNFIPQRTRKARIN